jgi:predicted DNA-binding ribbon-helix-helix protein
MRLEPELWEALNEICLREDLEMSNLVRQVEAAGKSGGRTSAIRVFILKYFRAAERGSPTEGRVPPPTQATGPSEHGHAD